MLLRKTCLSILVTLCLGVSTHGQSIDNYPTAFDQYFKSLFLINPSLIDTSEVISFSAGNRTLTGLFQGVTRFYGDVGGILRNKQHTRFHCFGVQAIAAKDGEFFSKNRAYVRYGFRASLSKRFSAALGFSFGAINYGIKASQASAGGNATAADGTIGVGLSYAMIDLGVSSQQIWQPRLTPIGQTFVLNRFFNYNLKVDIPVGKYVVLKNFMYIRQRVGEKILLQIAPILVWNKILETGTNLIPGRGWAVVAGITNLKIYKGDLRISGSYFISNLNTSGVNDRILEFTMGYAIKK